LVFNDLKLQNIMINENIDNDEDCNEVVLIDYGFASSYLQKDKKTHISPSSTTEVFRGNIFFASLNQLKFGTTSRKDDLISMFYFMIYTLNSFELPFLNSSKALKEKSVYSNFTEMTKIKEKFNL